MRENTNSNLTNADAGVVLPTCDTDKIRELFAGVPLPPVESELCDCQYCRAFTHYARLIHASVLSTIDVYSMPDETDSSEDK